MNEVTATKSRTQSTAAATPPQTIQDLPADIREKIFSELSATEALSARLVCKEWNVIISGDRLWNFFFHRDFKECTHSPGIGNARQAYILQSNIDHGKYLRQDLEGSFQTPILYVDGLIIYGNALPYLYQTIKILDTRSGDCVTIQSKPTSDQFVAFKFEALVYAEGFIFAATDNRPLIIGWDARTGDKIVEIKTRGIVDRLVYKDGMFFISFKDNLSNHEADIWNTVEIWDFNPKQKTRTEVLTEQWTLEAAPECGIQELPKEILFKIFCELKASEAAIARLVCKDWNTMISDSHLWRLYLNRDMELRKSSSSIENPRDTYILHSNLRRGVYTVLTHEFSDRHPPLCFAENKIIYAAKDKTIKVCNAVTGDCIKTLEGNEKNIEKLVYANGKLLSISLNNYLTIWDIETGESIAHEKPYLSADSFTYGDGRLFVGNRRGEVTIYDLEGRLINTLQGQSFIHQLSYTNGILFCSYMSHLSEMWDFNHGEPAEQIADDASSQVEDKEKQT